MATVAARDGNTNVEQVSHIELQVSVPEKQGIKAFLAYLGPGFLVSIAYIDPGNFETDLQSGAKYKYELLWVLLIASCSALLIQSLAANLGVISGKHLSEHCRIEYPRMVNVFLWIAAELAIIASDIPEVLGTAFAINLLFHIPIFVGVLLTGFSTLLLLALQQFGVSFLKLVDVTTCKCKHWNKPLFGLQVRKLEILISLLVFMMAICFLVEAFYAKPAPKEVLKGLFVPKLKGNGATGLAISLLGAMIMPDNSVSTSAKRFFLAESAIAIFVAFMINVAVISVSGAVCGNPNLASQDRGKCNEMDLNNASFLLKDVLGKWNSLLFGAVLIAAGQSSTITGTFAGQYVMEGFLTIKCVAWARNLFTRCAAIGPSLFAALVGGSSGAGNLIVISSMILSFELPFALIPLLRFTSSSKKMGPHKNLLVVTIITWLVGCGIVSINVYYLSTTFYFWLIGDHGFPKPAKFVIATLGFGAMFLYAMSVGYLVFRPEKERTYIEDLKIGTQELEVQSPSTRHSMDGSASFKLSQTRNMVFGASLGSFRLSQDSCRLSMDCSGNLRLSQIGSKEEP